MEEVITMADMALIFSVTDELGIDREVIRVELTKEDPGSVKRGAGNTIEIVAPLTAPAEEWVSTLSSELEKMGFRGDEDRSG